MIVRKLLAFLCLLICVVTVAGCASRKSKADHLASDQAKTQDDFTTAKKDPVVTPETRMAAGAWAEEMGQLGKAAELYRAALKSDPKNLAAMYRLGVVTSKMRQYPEAIEVWTRYVKATNESADAYSNLAYTYELAGKSNDAERNYAKAVERDPKNVASRVNFGVLLVKLGRVNEAMLQLQAVLTPAESHYNVASVYEAQGKKDQARHEYQVALQLDPSLKDAKERLDRIK